MCWNQYVSLNTFIFSVFVLLLIAFNNKYSNYKLNEFKSIYVYFFIMSFALMQFIEFILWRNLNNQLINDIKFFYIKIYALAQISSNHSALA